MSKVIGFNKLSAHYIGFIPLVGQSCSSVAATINVNEVQDILSVVTCEEMEVCEDLVAGVCRMDVNEDVVVLQDVNSDF